MSEAEKKYSNPGHELSDAKVKAVLISTAAFAGIAVLGFIITAGVFTLLRKNQLPPPVEPSLQRPVEVLTEPRLQVKPDMDFLIFRSEEDSLISNYGWVQKEAGVVRIPIDEAMKLALERGFPVRSDYEKWVESPGREGEDVGHEANSIEQEVIKPKKEN